MSNRATRSCERIHLGCGVNTPKDWLNVDGSWNARFAKVPALRKLLRILRIMPARQAAVTWSKDILVHNLRKPLPFGDEVASAVYASHLLEHLYLDEAERLLLECRRVLKPGGVLRLVVPDLRAIILEYMGEMSIGEAADEMTNLTRADRVNRRLLLRKPSLPSGMLYRIYTALTDFHSHKWMYDADSLAAHLTQAGFEGVREMDFCESRIQAIASVEQADRVLAGMGICVEGVRPASIGALPSLPA